MYTPGGILSTYKKKMNLTPEEVMEEGYWNKVRDLKDDVSEFFETVSKNERDLMNTTKNYVMRARLNREIDFTEDFRKRFMTREYGNYEKYEDTGVKQELEKGENDIGVDTFHKNLVDFDRRVNLPESEHTKTTDKNNFEGILLDESLQNQQL